MRTFYRKVKEEISAHKQVKQEDLIQLLNPILRGWAQYHSPVVAKATFSRVEHDIFRALRRWAKRRHPQKSSDWVRRKYFATIEGRNWVFGTTVANGDGSKRWTELYSLASTPVVRHKKIKGSYNPFDPAQEMYGETLRQRRLLQSMSHRKQWIKLYMDQRGLCALCQCKMTKETGWHDHHIEHRVFGGSNVLGNRVLLHPSCHALVHTRGIAVVKPAPWGAS